MKNDIRGFTLVEIIVVVAIIGGLVAVAVPAWQGYRKSMQLREAARTIASAMRLARAEAVTKGRETRVYINAQNNTYRIIRGTRGNGTPNADWTSPAAMSVIRNWTPVTSDPPTFPLQLKSGLAPTTACSSNNDVVVEFNTNGSSVNFSSGATALSGMFVCVMDNYTRSWRIGIANTMNGRVAIER